MLKSRRKIGLSIDRGLATALELEEKRGGVIVKNFQRRDLPPAWEEEASLGGEIVKAALKDILAQFQGIDVRLALADPMANLSLLELKGLPSGKRETERLIRWRLKGSLPYDVNRARIAFQFINQGKQGGERKALVLSVPDPLVSPLEDGILALSRRVRKISITSLYLNNILLSSIHNPPADFALVFILDNHFTVIIYCSSRPEFYRCKQSVGAISDLIPNIYTTFLYFYRNNPKVRIERVFLFSVLDNPEDQGELLKEALQTEIEVPDIFRSVKVEAGPSGKAAPEEMTPALAAALG